VQKAHKTELEKSRFELMANRKEMEVLRLRIQHLERLQRMGELGAQGGLVSESFANTHAEVNPYFKPSI
jgi:hypothetical protein